MWPNGSLPSAMTLITAAHSASKGRFLLDGVENHAARPFLLKSLLTTTRIDLLFFAQITQEPSVNGDIALNQI